MESVAVRVPCLSAETTIWCSSVLVPVSRTIPASYCTQQDEKSQKMKPARSLVWRESYRFSKDGTDHEIAINFFHEDAAAQASLLILNFLLRGMSRIRRARGRGVLMPVQAARCGQGAFQFAVYEAVRAARVAHGSRPAEIPWGDSAAGPFRSHGSGSNLSAPPHHRRGQIQIRTISLLWQLDLAGVFLVNRSQISKFWFKNIIMFWKILNCLAWILRGFWIFLYSGIPQVEAHQSQDLPWVETFAATTVSKSLAMAVWSRAPNQKCKA